MADGSVPDRSLFRQNLLRLFNNGTMDDGVDTDLERASSLISNRSDYIVNSMDRSHLRKLILKVMLVIIMGLFLWDVLAHGSSSFTLFFCVVALIAVGSIAFPLSLLLQNRMPWAAGYLSRLGVGAGSSAVVLATGMVLYTHYICVILLLCISTAAAILILISNIGTIDERVDTTLVLGFLAYNLFENLLSILIPAPQWVSINETTNVDNRRVYNIYTNVEGSHLSNRISNQQIDPEMLGITGVHNNFRSLGTNQLIDQLIITITGPTSFILMILIMEHPSSHFPPLFYFVGTANIVGFIAALISMLLRSGMPRVAGHLSRLGTAAVSSAVIMAMGLVTPRFSWAFVLLSVITVTAVLFGQTSHSA